MLIVVAFIEMAKKILFGSERKLTDFNTKKQALLLNDLHR